MFLTLARAYYEAGLKEPQKIQLLPARQLGQYVEESWYHYTLDELDGDFRKFDFGLELEQIRVALGDPQPESKSKTTPHGTAVSGLVAGQLAQPNAATGRRGAPFELQPDYKTLLPSNCRIWHHLIYAYLIEATGAYDVMAEVSKRLVAGESLGTLRPESIVWLRNTEQLFFRDPPVFGIAALTSDLRPSRSINRRRAYWKMFGMDMPHLIPAGWPGSGEPQDWKAHTSPGVNIDFQDKLVELLRQVWIGLTNAGNTSGPNQADPAYIALLCEAIGDMLRGRRLNGRMADVEFFYVNTMSWFHLTLLSNTPIVEDLQAQGTAPEQRLANLAQKVGMRSAARSRELFQVSELLSMLLRAIELRAFDEAGQAELLYDPNTQLGQDMRQIVNLWQSATGRRIKDHEMTPTAQPSQPIRVPAPGLVANEPTEIPVNGSARVMTNGVRTEVNV